MPPSAVPLVRVGGSAADMDGLLALGKMHAVRSGVIIGRGE